VASGKGKAWTPLRIAVLAGGVLGACFWIGCFIWWWRIPDIRRDGLELMGIMFATVYFICLALPALILGLLGRWLAAGAIFAALAVALASDTLFPWIPWQYVPSPP